MTEMILAFLYVVFFQAFAWLAGIMLAFYIGFYVITLIVDALSPAELTPDKSRISGD
jgi:hypothetical protein